MTAPTRHVVFIRHLKSDWSHGGMDDFDRPLAPRGLRAGAKLKDWIAERVPRFDLVLCSPARRTVQTMSVLGLADNARHPPELYLADSATIFDVLRRAPALPNIAVIGHNPGIGRAAAMLLQTPPEHPRFADYPTGATVIAECPADASLSAGSARLAAFIVPRDLDDGGA